MQPQTAPICEPVRRDKEPEPETLVTLDLDDMLFFRPVPVWVN